MESLSGKALVASPYLADPNFLRSVVYILQHDDEGALGVILNRPLETTVGEMIGQWTDETCSNTDPVYYGGPVDGPLMLLGAEKCDPGGTMMSIAAERERILDFCSQPSGTLDIEKCGDEKCSDEKSSKGESGEEKSGEAAEDRSPPCYRLFDGYAGWGPQQLDREMEDGGWLLWEVPPSVIFDDHENLWHRAVREIGREIIAGGIDADRIPADPAVN